MPVAVTRFANLYGGGDLNRSRLVPEVMVAVLAGRRPVIRSDGTPERDFLYVEDAAAAYLAIADALDDGPARGEAFNAGGGRPVAVRRGGVGWCAGWPGPTSSPTSGAPARRRARSTASTSTPRRSGELVRLGATVDLEEGLRRTIEWYRQHPELLSG